VARYPLGVMPMLTGGMQRQWGQQRTANPMVGGMKSISLSDGLVELVGALDVDDTPSGLVPRRLPAWTRPQIPDVFMDVVVQMPSGVRLRVGTTSTSLELDAMLTHLRQLPHDLRPAVFDLVVDGSLEEQAPTTLGNVFTLGARSTDEITFDEGVPTTISFRGLAPELKAIELWLPKVQWSNCVPYGSTTTLTCTPRPTPLHRVGSTLGVPSATALKRHHPPPSGQRWQRGRLESSC
jgi:hypothetical protein